MTERIWIVSNLLSISRVLLIIPITILLLKNDSSYRWYIFGLCIVTAFTDTLDGWIARKLNQVTELGKILDPLADKIALSIVTVVLTLQGLIPFWFLTLVIMRDAVIFAGGVFIKKINGIVPQSNLIGKWAITIVAVYIIIAILDFPEIIMFKQIMLILSTVMLSISFIFYYKRFLDITKNHFIGVE